MNPLGFYFEQLEMMKPSAGIQCSTGCRRFYSFFTAVFAVLMLLSWFWVSIKESFCDTSETYSLSGRYTSGKFILLLFFCDSLLIANFVVGALKAGQVACSFTC